MIQEINKYNPYQPKKKKKTKELQSRTQKLKFKKLNLVVSFYIVKDVDDEHDVENIKLLNEKVITCQICTRIQ